MRLVEIIRGKQTDDETIARAYDYVLAIGKTPIVVNDSRGFFTSRVFGTFVMEGVAMLAEGLPAPLIEHAGLAAGMPVGPLAVIDETSLSLSVHVMEQTRADLAAEGKTVEPDAGQRLVELMVKELKRPGRAGGGGFYDYPRGPAEDAVAGAEGALREAGAHADVAELSQRLLYRQAIETARCLSRGRADEHARRQHRLDLRHRLSALDGRRDAVHLQRGHGDVRGQRRGAGQPARAALRARRRQVLDCIASTPPERRSGAKRPCTQGLRAAVYFSVSTQAASCLASASLTCGLAGIGTGPQTPEPPFMIFCASLSTASLSPAYLAATSL